MAAMTLNLSDLQKSIGFMLGWGHQVFDPADDRAVQVDAIIAEGLRQFYLAHDWHFLTPHQTIDTVADDADYDLPSDFGGLVSDMTFDSETIFAPVRRTTDVRLRGMRQAQDASGKPAWCAIVPKTKDADADQAWELWLYPTPDAVYTLRYRMTILPAALTSTDYPYGGQYYSDAILASCRAAAELRMDDTSGVHRERYIELLAQSIRKDQMMGCPDTFGVNYDSSEEPGGIRRDNYVTVNGVLPD
jgi:hypothetical protein